MENLSHSPKARALRVRRVKMLGLKLKLQTFNPNWGGGLTNKCFVVRVRRSFQPDSYPPKRKEKGSLTKTTLNATVLLAHLQRDMVDSQFVPCIGRQLKVFPATDSPQPSVSRWERRRNALCGTRVKFFAFWYINSSFHRQARSFNLNLD